MWIYANSGCEHASYRLWVELFNGIRFANGTNKFAYFVNAVSIRCACVPLSSNLTSTSPHHMRAITTYLPPVSSYPTPTCADFLTLCSVP